MARHRGEAADSGQNYEVASPYVGAAGEAYFAYQRQGGKMGGVLNASKFQPYIRGEDTVLDFGCGGGFLLRALDCGTRIGVEPNAPAREMCSAMRTTCHASTAAVGDESVDVVVSNHALEHVPYPIGALRELRRVLKPNGKLVLCLPIDDRRAQRRFNPAEPNHHLHTWTPQLLGNTLLEAGFAFDSASIRVLCEAWPPRVDLLLRWLPPGLLRIVMWVWAKGTQRYQTFAVASRA